MSGHKGRHDFGCQCVTHVARPWNRPEHWSADEVAYLDRWYGRRTDEAIARHLHRTVVGLRLKAKRLGIYKRAQAMSGREVAAIFGVESSVVGKVWVRRRLLKAAYAAFRQGPYRMLMVEPESVEAFIREHPEYVDVAKMPDSPYRDLAAREPWIGTPEVHRLTGRNHHVIAEMVRDGAIRGRRRGTHWYIPLADVPLIRALRPDAIEESRFRRASGLAARRNRRKLRAAA